jgi:hypothetical protein
MSSGNLTILFNENGTPFTSGQTGQTGKTIFQLEETVVQKLNNFNSKYVEYLRCNPNIDDSVRTINQSRTSVISINDKLNNPPYTNKAGCPTSNVADESTVTTSYNEVESAIAALDAATTYIKTTSGGVSREVYDMSYNSMLSNHKSILKLRNELDVKMREINRTEDSVYSMYKANYDSTMYTSILWSVLASSLVYYIFVKL